MRAISSQPDGLSYNSLGLVYLTRKDYVGAAESFQVAVRSSQVPQVHSNLVWALLASEQYERAIPASERLIGLLAREDERIKKDELKIAYQELGFAYQKLGQATKAQAAYAEVNRIDPQWQFHSCEMKTDAKGDLTIGRS